MCPILQALLIMPYVDYSYYCTLEISLAIVLNLLIFWVFTLYAACDYVELAVVHVAG